MPCSNIPTDLRLWDRRYHYDLRALIFGIVSFLFCQHRIGTVTDLSRFAGKRLSFAVHGKKSRSTGSPRRVRPHRSFPSLIYAFL